MGDQKGLKAKRNFGACDPRSKPKPVAPAIEISSSTKSVRYITAEKKARSPLNRDRAYGKKLTLS
jgi:hypothetical protein